MTIVVTGGSGFLGTALCKRLLAENHTVIVVAKKAPPFTHKQLFFIHCDLETQPLPYNILERTDAVINLVGKSFYRRWSKNTLEEINSSRIESTKRVVESIASTSSRPTVFICASSTMYYGEQTDVVDETTKKGEGKISDMVELWEREAEKAAVHGVRVVSIRTATILGHGGLLSLIHRISRFRLLWKLSKKDFVMPWVHEEDVVNAYLFALETKTLQGVVNVAAPEPVSGNTLINIIAKKRKRLMVGTMPKWLKKIFFGELHLELTKNLAVLSSRLNDKGFTFIHTDPTEAIESLMKR